MRPGQITEISQNTDGIKKIKYLKNYISEIPNLYEGLRRSQKFIDESGKTNFRKLKKNFLVKHFYNEFFGLFLFML